MDRVHVWVQRFKDRSTLQLQWHDPVTRKRKSKSAKTADTEEAEKKRADLEYELNHGLHREPSKMAWEKFTEAYFEEKMSANRPRTIEKADGVLRRFAEIIRPRNLAAVNERAVSRYAAALRQEGYQASTIDSHLIYLRAAFNWAEEQGLLVSAPKIKTRPLKKKTIRTITAEEFERLIAKAPDWSWRALVATAWYTGMRRNELLDLTWDEPDRPHVDFVPTAKWPRGRVVLPGSCTKSGIDSWIPLHKDLAAILSESTLRRGRLFRFSVCPGTVSRRFKSLAASAGLRITLHDLRKSFGSRYASIVPAAVLQRLMRHQDIKTTLQFYTDVENKLADAIHLG